MEPSSYHLAWVPIRLPSSHSLLEKRETHRITPQVTIVGLQPTDKGEDQPHDEKRNKKRNADYEQAENGRHHPIDNLRDEKTRPPRW